MKRKILCIILILSILVLCISCSIKSPSLQDNKTPNNTKTDSSIENLDFVTLVIYDYSKYSWSPIRNLLLELSSYMPYPTEIRLVQPKDDKNELAILLMSGDKSFDIYNCSSDEGNSLLLLEQNYFVDLSSDEDIKDLFDEMYSSVGDLFVYNNKIFGFPNDDMHPNVLIDNNAIFKDSRNKNLNSIDDLIQLRESLDIKDDNNKQAIIMPDEWFYEKYFVNTVLLAFDPETRYVDFSSIDFLTLMETKKKLIDGGIIYRE